MTQENKRGSYITGLIGALLGGILSAFIFAGAILLTDSVRYFFGIIFGIFVVKGYDILGGKRGTLRAILCLIIVIAAIFVGVFGYYVWDLHQAYQDEAYIQALMDETEFMRYTFTENEEYLKLFKPEFTKILIITYIVGLLGYIGSIVDTKKNETSDDRTPTDSSASTEQNTAFNQLPPDNGSNSSY